MTFILFITLSACHGSGNIIKNLQRKIMTKQDIDISVLFISVF